MQDDFPQRLAATRRAALNLYMDIQLLYAECNLPYQGLGSGLDEACDTIDEALDEIADAVMAA